VENAKISTTMKSEGDLSIACGVVSKILWGSLRPKSKCSKMAGKGLHLHDHTQNTNRLATDKTSTEQKADILGSSLLWEVNAA
jgi:hypothetical protein